MYGTRKLVLVIHHDLEAGKEIKEGLQRRKVPAFLVTTGKQLVQLILTFRVHYVIMDAPMGTSLERVSQDWMATPSGDGRHIPVLDLRQGQYPGADAVCQAVALDLARSC